MTKWVLRVLSSQEINRHHRSYIQDFSVLRKRLEELMPQKNKMEGKKLNLNCPLLSVRRRSMTSQKDYKIKTANSLHIAPWLSPYRSELQLCPIKNPGAVPFQWEHVPGRPKEDLKPHSQYCPKPPIAPKIHSGRYPNANKTDSHRISQTNNENRGKTVNVPQNSKNYSYLHERVRNMERMKETSKELESSNSGDSNEAYVDPLDTETPDNAPKNKPVVREEKQVKKMENQVTSLRYGPRFTNMFSHCDTGEEEKSDDGSDRSGNLPGVCWLLPPFCSKSSVGVLNHVPTMSMRSRVLMSRISNMKPRSSSSGSYKSTENESKSDISHQQSINKILTAEFEEKTRLRNKSGQSHNTSTYRDARNNSFGSHGKRFKTFQEFLAYKGSLEELNFEGVFEKTLYIDTVHKVESPKSRSCSPFMQDSKGVRDSSDEDCEIITKRMDQMHVKDSYVKDFTKFDTVEGKMVPNAQEIDGFNIQSSIDKLKIKRQKFWDFPVPPPLPKSPSDSWLGRTLPSISSKNRSYSSTNLQNQFSKGNTGNFQWEATVESTNVQCQENLKPIPET